MVYLIIEKNTTLILTTNSTSLLLSYISLTILLLCLPLSDSGPLTNMLSTITLLCIIFYNSNSTLLIWLSFELTTIPILFIIYLWGYQSEILLASYYIAIYSLVGGLPYLTAISMSNNYNNSWCSELISTEIAIVVSLPFILKLPCYYFHLWLPLAHVEAPTVGSMLLASIMLKLGSVGLIHVINNLPGLVIVVSVVGIITVPLITLTQSDMNCIIAYSSISHLCFFSLGLWLNTTSSDNSSSLLQTSHGFLSALLFLVVGITTTLSSSRITTHYNLNKSTLLATLALLNAGSSLSLSFLSETLLITTITSISNHTLLLVILSVLLTIAYNLYIVSLSQTNTKTPTLTSSVVTATVVITTSLLTLPLYII